MKPDTWAKTPSLEDSKEMWILETEAKHYLSATMLYLGRPKEMTALKMVGKPELLNPPKGVLHMEVDVFQMAEFSESNESKFRQGGHSNWGANK